jgi:hypothetical protein
MIATDDQLISLVAAQAGVATDLAGLAVRTVMTGIGAYLTLPGRQLVARELPRMAAAALLADDDWTTVPIDNRLLGPEVTAGQARVLLASVVRVLVERLSAEAVGALRRRAPLEVAPFIPPPPREALDARLESLAGARS